MKKKRKMALSGNRCRTKIKQYKSKDSLETNLKLILKNCVSFSWTANFFFPFPLLFVSMYINSSFKNSGSL